MHHVKTIKDVISHINKAMIFSVGGVCGTPNNQRATNSDVNMPNNHKSIFAIIYRFVIVCPSRYEYIERIIAEADSKTISMPSTAKLDANNGDKIYDNNALMDNAIIASTMIIILNEVLLAEQRWTVV